MHTHPERLKTTQYLPLAGKIGDVPSLVYLLARLVLLYLMERAMFLAYPISVTVYGGDDTRVVAAYCRLIIAICGSIDRR